METSFATIGRVFGPYGAGGRHGRIFVMQKMRVGNMLANLSGRDRPRLLCNSRFMDTSNIYVVERGQSFRMSHWTLSGSDFKVAGDTLYEAH